MRQLFGYTFELEDERPRIDLASCPTFERKPKALEGGLSDRRAHFPALIFKFRSRQARVLQVKVREVCCGEISDRRVRSANWRGQIAGIREGEERHPRLHAIKGPCLVFHAHAP